jgi:hypothetical protein
MMNQENPEYEEEGMSKNNDTGSSVLNDEEAKIADMMNNIKLENQKKYNEYIQKISLSLANKVINGLKRLHWYNRHGLILIHKMLVCRDRYILEKITDKLKNLNIDLVFIFVDKNDQTLFIFRTDESIRIHSTVKNANSAYVQTVSMCCLSPDYIGTVLRTNIIRPEDAAIRLIEKSYKHVCESEKTSKFIDPYRGKALSYIDNIDFSEYTIKIDIDPEVGGILLCDEFVFPYPGGDKGQPPSLPIIVHFRSIILKSKK